MAAGFTWPIFWGCWSRRRVWGAAHLSALAVFLLHQPIKSPRKTASKKPPDPHGGRNGSLLSMGWWRYLFALVIANVESISSCRC
jgi:hypothetical protein